MDTGSEREVSLQEWWHWCGGKAKVYKGLRREKTANLWCCRLVLCYWSHLPCWTPCDRLKQYRKSKHYCWNNVLRFCTFRPVTCCEGLSHFTATATPFPSLSAMFSLKYHFVLGWIALERQRMWILPCGNSLFCVNFTYVQNWCRAKRSLFDVSIQVACNYVIIGCTRQAIEVRWLIDLTRLFFYRYVTNIPLVIFALPTGHAMLNWEWEVSVGPQLVMQGLCLCACCLSRLSGNLLAGSGAPRVILCWDSFHPFVNVVFWWPRSGGFGGWWDICDESLPICSW